MKLARNPLIGGAILIFVLILPLVSLGQAADGVIKGKVVNKTGGEKVVPGLKVTLRKFVDKNQKEDLQAEADESGNFEFKNLTKEKNETYYVLLQYKKVEYFSDPLVFKENEKEKTADISVYELTESSKDVKLKLHHIVIDVKESKMLTVKEILLFENTGDKTVIGSKELEPGKKETLNFSLPSRAHELKHEQGVFDAFAVMGDDGFKDTMPITPGQRQVLYSYELETGSSEFVFKRPIDYETPDFSLFVANKGLKVSSSTLTSQGTSKGEEGTDYLHFSGQNLKPGRSLTAEISGVPTGQGVFQWIAYFLITLLIIGGLSFPFLRKKMRRARRDAQEVGRTAADPMLDLEREQKSLLLTIAALDDKFETGGISSDDYKRERSERKRKLVEVTEKLRKK